MQGEISSLFVLLPQRPVLEPAADKRYELSDAQDRLPLGDRLGSTAESPRRVREPARPRAADGIEAGMHVAHV